MAGPARTITPLPSRHVHRRATTLSELQSSRRDEPMVRMEGLIAKAFDGKLNNTGTLTLATGGATTTDIDDPRIVPTTIAWLVGIDQNGAASIPSISQAVQQPGKIRLTHAASGLTRTIGYILFACFFGVWIGLPALAQSPSLIGFPGATDPTCAAGEYYLAVNTTTTTWRKCQNGTWSDMGSAAGAGEANTASNLGGGLANWDSKSGVDLRFNSFAAADFNLSANLISIDTGIWATDAEVAAGYQPLDTDLTDLADGILTFSKVGGATISRCARFDGSGNLIAASADCASGDTGGAPGGSSTNVQFNDSSAFGGDAQLAWDKTGNTLTVGDGSTQGNLDVKCPTPGSMDCQSTYVEDTVFSGTPASGLRRLQARSTGFFTIDSAGTTQQLAQAASSAAATEHCAILSITVVAIDHYLTKINYAGTLSRVSCISSGSITTAPTYHLAECTSTGASCSDNTTSALTCDADGDETTTFGGAAGSAIDATDWMQANSTNTGNITGQTTFQACWVPT